MLVLRFFFVCHVTSVIFLGPRNANESSYFLPSTKFLSSLRKTVEKSVRSGPLGRVKPTFFDCFACLRTVLKKLAAARTSSRALHHLTHLNELLDGFAALDDLEGLLAAHLA